MKWLWWLCRLAVSSAIVSMISVATTWYVVNHQLAAVMKQWNLQPAQTAPLDWTGALSDMYRNSLASIPVLGAWLGDPQTDERSLGNLPLSGKPTAEPEPANRDERVPEDAVAVWGSVSAEPEPGASGTSGESAEGSSGDGAPEESAWVDSESAGLLMSTEQFMAARDSMAPQDKMRVFALLVSRLHTEELQRVSEIVENGVTGEEYTELEDIVKNRLLPEEYRELKEIVSRYEEG